MQALIFDFDGTILDTESNEFSAWQEVFQSYGGQLTLEYWLPFIGNNAPHFDPLGELERQIGRPLDRPRLLHQVETRIEELNQALKPLPGVLDYLEAARAMGLKLAVASSSSRAWVERHLARVGLLERFAVIRTKEDVPRTKPDPALFLRAAEDLGIPPQQTIVLEDSLNGVRAAKAAGAFTVAVPNPLTRHLDLSQADLVLTSLCDLALWELLPIALWKSRGQRPPIA